MQIAIILLQVALLSEIVGSWLSTLANHRGLFDASFDVEAMQTSLSEEAGLADPLEDDTILEATSAVKGISAHHAWLIFLLEAWQVIPCLLKHVAMQYSASWDVSNVLDCAVT